MKQIPLETIYDLSKAHRDFNSFKSAIDEIITGTPPTELSNNKFKVVQS